MTRKEYQEARKLADSLLKVTRKGSVGHELATKLAALLKPPPNLAEILLSLEIGGTHKDRAALIGLSRQGYYNLLQGLARPNSMTTKRLALLTGLTEEAIRQAAP